MTGKRSGGGGALLPQVHRSAAQAPTFKRKRPESVRLRALGFGSGGALRPSLHLAGVGAGVSPIRLI